MSDKHPDPSALWRFRRKHSFMAHWTLIITTAGLILAELVRPGTVEGLKPLLYPVYGSLVMIVLGYIANAALETWAKEKWK